jgi:YjbE family integral membrane protein
MPLYPELVALVSVIVIDLVLAGDNAVVVGMAAAGLRQELRKKAIVIGIGAAALLRILFAVFATQLLGVIGLTLAGGLLLLWVAWKLWRETQKSAHRRELAGAEALDSDGSRRVAASAAPGTAGAPAASKTLGAALFQIVIADVSMSLDNVLAVAGTARDHVWVLIVGLSLSVALMGAAATLVARLLGRYPWISYLGLVLIAWVALTMIWEGGWDVFGAARGRGIL